MSNNNSGINQWPDPNKIRVNVTVEPPRVNGTEPLLLPSHEVRNIYLEGLRAIPEILEKYQKMVEQKGGSLSLEDEAAVTIWLRNGSKADSRGVMENRAEAESLPPAKTAYDVYERKKSEVEALVKKYCREHPKKHFSDSLKERIKTKIHAIRAIYSASKSNEIIDRKFGQVGSLTRAYGNMTNLEVYVALWIYLRPTAQDGQEDLTAMRIAFDIIKQDAYGPP